MNIENQALEFMRKLFELYFEKQDFEGFLGMLSEDVLWIGAQEQESAQGLAQIRALLMDAQKNGMITTVEVAYPQYSAHALNAQMCSVSGKMALRVVALGAEESPHYCRFSALCGCKGDGLELLQAHISTPLPNSMREVKQCHKIEEAHSFLLAQKKQLDLCKKRYELAMQHVGIIVFDYLPATKQILNSDLNVQRYGLPAVMENAVDTLVSSGSIHPNSIRLLREMYERIDAGLSFAQGTLSLLNYNGEETCKELYLTNLLDGDKLPMHAIGVLTDVTSASLLEKEKQYRRAMTSDKILAFEANISKNMVEHINDDWANMLEVPMIFDFYLLITYMECHVLHPDFSQAYGEFFAKDTLMDALENGRASCALEYRRKDKHDVYSWVQNTVHIIRDEPTGIVRLRCYARNIDEEKEKELDLIYRSRHDVLTGLLNKSTTEQVVEDYLATREGKNGTHCFLIFDIDNFKNINDSFGHAFGDRVLAHVGVKVRNLFRTDDILGLVGGDEFVVLMKQAPKQDYVIEKAKELCRRMAETYNHNHKELNVSVSIGLALYCEHGTNYQQLYKNSDKALYHAKAQGKNGFFIFNEELVEK